MCILSFAQLENRSSRAMTAPSSAYFAAGSVLLEDLADQIRRWADEPLRQAAAASAAGRQAPENDKL